MTLPISILKLPSVTLSTVSFSKKIDWFCFTLLILTPWKEVLKIDFTLVVAAIYMHSVNFVCWKSNSYMYYIIKVFTKYCNCNIGKKEWKTIYPMKWFLKTWWSSSFYKSYFRSWDPTLIFESSEVLYSINKFSRSQGTSTK